MQYENRDKIWFPEPEIEDATHGMHGEHTLDYLARSTVQRAIAYRKALNYHLSKMPLEFQEHFLNASRKHWQSVIFEMIVGRFLQELGADLLIEQEIISGKRPDFSATFSDGKVIVEATVPLINADVGKKVKQTNPLLSFIKEHVPEGWYVWVRKLPDIGLADSKRHFKEVLLDLFSKIDSNQYQDEINFTRTFDYGILDLKLTRHNKPKGILAAEPPVGFIDNTEARIINALKKKKKQVSESRFPVILAIHASGIASEWDDFDRALIGHSVDSYNQNLNKINDDFRTDGYLYNRQRKTLTYAGVLAFVTVDVLYGSDPVFYKNPHFEEEFPSAFESLQQRFFDIESKRIFSKPARSQNIMEKIRNDALG